MKPVVKRVLVGMSVLANAAFGALMIMSARMNVGAINYFDAGAGYAVTANVVSVPEGARVQVGVPEIILKPGQKAALQLSVAKNGRQSNYTLYALYNDRVASVETDGWGLTVIAIAEGETTLQTMTNDGFRNIAVIKVVS
jgi:hypothetical protein